MSLSFIKKVSDSQVAGIKAHAEAKNKERNRGTLMNDEHKEKIYYIQQQADELSAEISKLMKKMLTFQKNILMN